MAHKLNKMGLSEENKIRRLGTFSASENFKLMGKKGLGKTGETYAYEVAAESLTGRPAKEEFSSVPTDWGNKHEPEAIAYFEAASGLEVESEQFTITGDGLLSGTPDGFIKGKECGIEIKCPYNSANHLKNLTITNQNELKELRPEYYWQIVTYMYLTGLGTWKFVSYDPRFKNEMKMVSITVTRSERDVSELMSRVAMALEVKNSILNRFKTEK